MPDEIRIILSSIDTEAAAARLAEGLIGAGLAACVQISAPGRSLYRWKDEVASDAEHYLVIKTSRGEAPRAVAWLERHHPYETPEIVLLAAEAADAYAGWLHGEGLAAR